MTQCIREREVARPASSAAAQWRGGIALIAAVFLIGILPLVLGRVSAVRDGSRFFLPYYTLVGDFARSGRLLLWNPYSAGGVPDFAGPQIGSLSPLTVLVAWLTGGTEAGFRTYWILVWGAGGLGMHCLARHLRAPAWAGVVVALGTIASGQYTGGGPWISHLVSASGLPFAVWRLDAALRSRRSLPALQAGAIWGLTSIGGYPGLTICSGAYLALWSFGRSVLDPGESGRSLSAATRLRSGLRSILAVLLTGALVLAPTYFSFFHELAGYGIRGAALSREAVVSDNALAVGALSTFASPFLAQLKGQAPRAIWPTTWQESVSIYLGPCILLLAVQALLVRPSRWRCWLLLVAVCSLAASLGDATPVRGWLYDLLPPFRFFRHTSLMRFYGMFTAGVLALLAARDSDGLLRGRSFHRGRMLAAATVASVAIVAALAALASHRHLFGMDFGAMAVTDAEVGARPTWGAAFSHLLLLWGAAGLASVALWARSWHRVAAMLLLGAAAADAAWTLRTSLPLSAAGETAAFWRRVEQDRSSSLELTPRGLERVLKSSYLGATAASYNENLPSKTPTLESYNSMWSPQYGLLLHYPALADFALGRDRVWFAEEVGEASPSVANAILYAEAVTADRHPIVIHERSSLLGQQGAAADPGLVEELHRLPTAVRLAPDVTRYTPLALDFTVECPGSGWLVVTDRWSRSWGATVNGERAVVAGANFLFRAVRVTAGANRVEFRYEPRWLWPFLAVSWGLLAAVLVASLRPARRLRR